MSLKIQSVVVNLISKKAAAFFILLLLYSLAFLSAAYAQNKTLDAATQKQETATAQNAEISDSAQVAPFDKALFSIYGDVGVVTAKQRASIIENNIISLKKAVVFDEALLKVVETPESSNIIYNDKTIAGITQQQADILGKSKNEIAGEYLTIIISAVTQERSKNELVILLKQIGLILLIIAFAFFCIKGINRLHDYIKDILTKKKDAKSATLLELDKHMEIFFSLLKILKFLLIIFMAYVCFLALLWFFPETHKIAYTLIDRIKTPIVKALLAIWHYLPNLLEIAIIVILAQIFSKILQTIAYRVAQGKIKINNFHPDWAKPTLQIARIIIVIFAFIFIFPLLPNSNSAIFKGISVFLGFIVSLGSTSLISNIVSGFVITYMRPFAIGDRIKMGEHFGDVIEKTSLVTRIKTPKNEVITIPNSAIMTATTTNYTTSANQYGLILHTQITLGYENDWRKIHEMMIEAALKTAHISPDPKPFVYQSALGDFHITYMINAYTKEAGKMNFIYSELHKNILDVFNRENIEIMSPHYTSIRDGNESTVPQSYLNGGNILKQPKPDSREKK